MSRVGGKTVRINETLKRALIGTAIAATFVVVAQTGRTIGFIDGVGGPQWDAAWGPQAADWPQTQPLITLTNDIPSKGDDYGGISLNEVISGITNAGLDPNGLVGGVDTGELGGNDHIELADKQKKRLANDPALRKRLEQLRADRGLSTSTSVLTQRGPSSKSSVPSMVSSTQ
jgi:hypothetical protein